jgi:hypothetical protein
MVASACKASQNKVPADYFRQVLAQVSRWWLDRRPPRHTAEGVTVLGRPGHPPITVVGREPNCLAASITPCCAVVRR